MPWTISQGISGRKYHGGGSVCQSVATAVPASAEYRVPCAHVQLRSLELFPGRTPGGNPGHLNNPHSYSKRG